MAGETVILKDGKGADLPIAIYTDSNGNKVAAVVILVNGRPVSDTNPMPLAGGQGGSTAVGATAANQAASLDILSDMLETLQDKRVTSIPETRDFLAQAVMTVGTASTLIAAPSVSRKYITFINYGPGPVWLSVGEAAVSGRGIPLMANGSISFDTGTIPSDAFYALLHDSAQASSIYVLQG